MKIVVWHHAVLSGPRIPNEDHTLAIFCEQMRALKESGLADAADRLNVGVNGPDRDALVALACAPEKTRLHLHPAGQSELSTLYCLQQSLEPGWLVFYHHMKGVQYPGNPVWDRWRDCMERACVWNWLDCVYALQNGNDTCGAHWLTHRKYQMVPEGQRYWGGNFWWASSDFLMTLPPVAADTWENRFQAEVWIGQGPRAPIVQDFAPHFPMSCP